MKLNVLVDSCGWIEFFARGALAEKYEQYIANANKRTHFTPTIVLYEVYKRVKPDVGEERALEACARIIAHTTVVPLDESLALEAADVSLSHKLSMADAIIKASAERHNAYVVTSDEHLGKLDGVKFIT